MLQGQSRVKGNAVHLADAAEEPDKVLWGQGKVLHHKPSHTPIWPNRKNCFAYATYRLDLFACAK